MITNDIVYLISGALALLGLAFFLPNIGSALAALKTDKIIKKNEEETTEARKQIGAIDSNVVELIVKKAVIDQRVEDLKTKEFQPGEVKAFFDELEKKK